jgi:hypothetical protein
MLITQLFSHDDKTPPILNGFTAQSSTALPDPASLLGLPREIRDSILRYLLPDVDFIPYRAPEARDPSFPQLPLMIPSSDQLTFYNERGELRFGQFPSHSSYQSLREDGDSSWPQLLAVNQQLQEEGRHILYHKRTFEVLVFSPFVHSRDRSLDAPGNAGAVWFYADLRKADRRLTASKISGKLRSVESLQITFCGEFDTTISGDYKKYQRMTGKLVDWVVNSGTIRKLILTHRILPFPRHARPVSANDFLLHQYFSMGLKDSLLWILRPFEKLRELVNVEVRFSIGDYETHLCI